jgi:hypothetical protein
MFTHVYRYIVYLQLASQISAWRPFPGPVPLLTRTERTGWKPRPEAWYNISLWLFLFFLYLVSFVFYTKWLITSGSRLHYRMMIIHGWRCLLATLPHQRQCVPQQLIYHVIHSIMSASWGLWNLFADVMMIGSMRASGAQVSSQGRLQCALSS